MPQSERRAQSDRRHVPRGGRRPYDKAGRYPLVLVADAFDVVRRSCAQYLDHLNFEVVQATTHEDMTLLLAMSPPQLILAGLTLRGRTAVAPWMETVSSNAIPMIAITNVEDVPLTATDGRLRRPFTQTQMITEVRRVLRAAVTNNRPPRASSTPRVDPQAAPNSDVWAQSETGSDRGQRSTSSTPWRLA